MQLHRVIFIVLVLLGILVFLGPPVYILIQDLLNGGQMWEEMTR